MRTNILSPCWGAHGEGLKLPKALSTVVSRLEKMIDTSAGPEACHPWTGALSDFGHGVSTYKKDNGRWTTRPAHRAAWIEANGPIDDELFVRHLCNNPPCCNLKHLAVGTQVDNMADRIETGAGYAYGADNKTCSISSETVDQIRAAYQFGVRGAGAPAIAARFGVSKTQVQRIVNLELRMKG